MARRLSPLAWLARRLRPATGAVLACAVGSAVLVAGWGGFPYVVPGGASQLVGVGAMYLVFGLGVAAGIRWSSSSFRVLASVTALALVVGYLCLLAYHVRRGMTAGPLGVPLVADALVPTLEEYLGFLPVGLFALLGAADGATERQYALSAVVLALAFSATVELLTGYSGGVPVLEVLFVLVVVVLVLVLGTPLYVLGATVRTHRRDDRP